MSPSVEELEQQRLIWRGRDRACPLAARPSGWAALDERLGGLPGAGVIALQSPVGIGELRLLWPTLRQSPGLTVLVNPPYVIGSEAWQGAGLALEQCLVVHPDSPRSVLWAAEQSLKSGCCPNVCLWLTERLQTLQARRLQLAARTGQSTLFLFLSPTDANRSLPVDMYLSLTPHSQGLNVEVPRRRQGVALAPFILSMVSEWPELTRSSQGVSRPTKVHTPRTEAV